MLTKPHAAASYSSISQVSLPAVAPPGFERIQSGKKKGSSKRGCKDSVKNNSALFEGGAPNMNEVVKIPAGKVLGCHGSFYTQFA